MKEIKIKIKEGNFGKEQFPAQITTYETNEGMIAQIFYRTKENYSMDFNYIWCKVNKEKTGFYAVPYKYTYTPILTGKPMDYDKVALSSKFEEILGITWEECYNELKCQTPDGIYMDENGNDIFLNEIYFKEEQEDVIDQNDAEEILSKSKDLSKSKRVSKRKKINTTTEQWKEKIQVGLSSLKEKIVSLYQKLKDVIATDEKKGDYSYAIYETNYIPKEGAQLLKRTRSKGICNCYHSREVPLAFITGNINGNLHRKYNNGFINYISQKYPFLKKKDIHDIAYIVDEKNITDPTELDEIIDEYIKNGNKVKKPL